MDSTPAATAETDTTRESLLLRLQDLVAESELLLKHVQRTGNEQFDAARARLEAKLDSAHDELETLQDNALRKARRAARQADQAVHHHPYASMGVAAAVGALIGMLIARR